MTTTTREPNQGMRRHKLMTAELRKAFPGVYATEGNTKGATVVAKFFSPYSSFTFLATEFDGEDMLFGWTTTNGTEWEPGYQSLLELASASRGRLPLIERDCYWTPCKVDEAKGA